MAECSFGLGVASEPHRISERHPCWYADKGRKVAVTWRDVGGPPLFTKLERGHGYVAVKWDKMVVIGVYIPPKLQIAHFESRLNRLTACIRRNRSQPVLIAGDFNAHSLL